MKYLLKFEFRYTALNGAKDDSNCVNKTVTIGIYDTIKEAVEIGNKQLNILADYFDIRDTFKINGLFGLPDTLVTNTCTKDKVQFFATITSLHFTDLKDIALTAIQSRKECDNHIG